jgi:dTDP-L-rhamnose 4-epimerase
MRHVLITGGAGFIGTHLTRLALALGWRVRVLDNLSPQIHGSEPFHVPDGVEFVHGDVTQREDWMRALDGVDTVVHLAAETGTGQSMYQIDNYYRVNVQGTAVAFDVLANEPHLVSDFVLASSRSVYGEGAYLCRACESVGARRFPGARSVQALAAQRWAPDCPECGAVIVPIASREDDPTSPASIYAATKLAQEDLVKVGSAALGIRPTILRFQNVFGEGQSLRNPYTGILSIFSTRIRLGQSLPIFEDGEPTRDFVHVEDVVTAIVKSIERAGTAGTTLNVGLGEPISIMAIARLLQRIMRSPIAPHVTGQYRLGDIRHNYADVSRLEKETGFRPRVPIEEGLARFTDWVLTQPVPQDLLDKANAELRARKLMA